MVINQVGFVADHPAFAKRQPEELEVPRMSLSINYISSMGHRGPKSTRVNFGPLADGVRLWAWVPNAVADAICEGMTIAGDFSVRPAGDIETSFTQNGVTVEKRVPTQQVWVNGSPVFDAPASDISAPEFTVSEQATAYRLAVLAKRAANAQTGDSSPL